MGTLAALIGQDQGLSVTLLRLANPARDSPRQAIATLKDAANSIGCKACAIGQWRPAWRARFRPRRGLIGCA